MSRRAVHAIHSFVRAECSDKRADMFCLLGSATPELLPHVWYSLQLRHPFH
jgi:hypothetical protein